MPKPTNFVNYRLLLQDKVISINFLTLLDIIMTFCKLYTIMLINGIVIEKNVSDYCMVWHSIYKKSGRLSIQVPISELHISP